MKRYATRCLGLVTVMLMLGTATASAQPLGTFRWQLQPFCNVLTLNVTHTAGVYTLDGFDDLCGAAARVSANGLAVTNPDGSITFGLTLVLAAGAAPLHIYSTINLTTISGTWRDSAGNTGTFAFNPVAPVGAPRPAIASTGVHWVNVNANATIRTTSAGLTGTTVTRPAGSPAGVYCLRFPASAVATREAAVGSLQQEVGGAGAAGFIHVTVTFGSLCNAIGTWNVAVQTYAMNGTPADRPFTLIIPRQ